VPLIEIGAPSDGGAALRAALSSVPPGSWLVVTAATAVAPVLAAAPSFEHLVGLKVAALGPATAQALEVAGLAVDVVGRGGGGRGLVEPLLAELAGRDEIVVLAQAEEPQGALASELRRAGIELIEASAYTTRPRSVSEAERAPLVASSLVVLASPSAARALADAVAGHTGPTPSVVTFGETTADAARALGFDDVRAAMDPDTESVIDALLASWSARSGDA
jgi:uroporphyrinogen-III synthase